MEVLGIHCIVVEFLVEVNGILCGIPQITVNAIEHHGILHGTFLLVPSPSNSNGLRGLTRSNERVSI